MASPNKVTINQGRVLPLPFRFFILIAVLAGMSFAMSNLPEIPAIMVCIVISFLIPLAWTTYYILQIIAESKTIKEGYWIMGIKKLSSRKYAGVDKVFVNISKSSQRATSYGGQTATFQDQEFKAFLKTSDGQTVELISSKSEETLMNRLKPIQKKLETSIEKNY